MPVLPNCDLGVSSGYVQLCLYCPVSDIGGCLFVHLCLCYQDGKGQGGARVKDWHSVHDEVFSEVAFLSTIIDNHIASNDTSYALCTSVDGLVPEAPSEKTMMR